ncbi:uncharacterized protein NPIL_521621 [Nephila pilipes]|uniref:Uncharacterized protein n=1 Tax=Nephila pilipes TaxID=299642 RepID=A0A8X6UD55_NEPPI|nr:uncharacterized protein NPIL_521621 [Nephila pilipes]
METNRIRHTATALFRQLRIQSNEGPRNGVEHRRKLSYNRNSKLNGIFVSKRIAKRFLLQAAGKILDPLGVFTLFIVRVKCHFLGLWVRKIPWDGDLPLDIQEKWFRWCIEFPRLSNLKIP